MNVLSVCLLLLLCSFVFFLLGQTQPNKKAQKLIREKLEKEQARELALGKVWKCSSIIWNYPGPLGSGISVMVLDSGTERTTVMYYTGDDIRICVGDKIVFRMRNKRDILNNVCVSLVDRYCIPYRQKIM